MNDRADGSEPWIVVSDDDGDSRLVRTREIIAIRSGRRGSEILTAEQSLDCNLSLTELESILDPRQFRRTNRSMIVNLDTIEKIVRRPRGDFDISLKNGPVVRLTTTYRDDFQRELIGKL